MSDIKLSKKRKVALYRLLNKDFTIRALDSNYEEFLSSENTKDKIEYHKEFKEHYGVNFDEMDKALLALLDFLKK